MDILKNNDLIVSFHDMGTIPETEIKFVVLQAYHQGQWLFVKHKDRATWEIPGGHIEIGETPDEAARRELIEETGALDFNIEPLCDYSVTVGCNEPTYGRLYYCDVASLGQLGPWEIEEITMRKSLPRDLTYAAIQPHLFQWVVNRKGLNLNQPFRIEKCTIQDLKVLQDLSIQTYRQTFDASNTEENMKSYLEKAFDLSKLKKELETLGSTFYFLYYNTEVAGYMKINEMPAQTDIYDIKALELERIYTLNAYHGMGGGQMLMAKAIEITKALSKDYLWLGVWEHNERALKFYQKHGFYQIGKHDFVMGDDVQTDFVLRKDL